MIKKYIPLVYIISKSLLLIIVTIILCSSYTQCITPKRLLNNTNNYSSHKNTNATIMIYDTKTGKLTYKITAKNIYQHNTTQNIYFKKIFATMFNKDHAPIWYIQSDQAKLTNKKILLLSGNIQINNTLKSSSLKKITTNHSIIDLVTHNTYSEDITLYGNCFISTSMKMRSNLNNNIIELISHVKTSYTI
ncbi:LPS export ABC transporter periplasmic protein LptC [Blochmannia endosymbiont of Camponotus (Colobopsis) obliquus]|uniref:LPS export ABC transporter periplasmic protein LptC n=1 Tax=Blochmannia endosymbiont of Camponotus (Colobopsis) obliquus TaxID=1505597 RepID=UPI00061A66AE|nr:LPS export ABC transporter periplasmic protein LptC [Blochmannia endosymbiont of Camponotus (Colobopsis) obliquus]AKC60226.1 Lipopolysaccharide export system protein LptC [Blochmannia endosymbiont of Camponotus (Colobopsis) obliquus]